MKDAKPGDPPPVLAGYTEPSAVFLNGTNTGLSDGGGAAEIAVTQGGLAAVEDRERPAFLAHLAEREADATAVDELTGFNYSRGRKVHITVYRVDALHDVVSLRRSDRTQPDRLLLLPVLFKTLKIVLRCCAF